MEQTPTPTEQLALVTKQQLDSLPIKAEDLRAKVELYKGLTINGVQDKEGLNKVYEARQDLKKTRVLIEKGAKRIRDVFTQINRDVSEKEKELVSIIGPTEDELQEKEDAIAREKKRLRDEEDAREAKILQDKIDKLASVGYAVDFVQLKGMTDEDFTATLAEATKAHEEKLERQRKEKDEREAEELRKEQERQAELKRLEEQRIQQEAERKKLEEEQAAFRAEQIRVQRENDEKERIAREEREKLQKEQENLLIQKVKVRFERLQNLGMYRGAGGDWFYQAKEINRLYAVAWDDAKEKTDVEFDNIVEDAKIAIIGIEKERELFRKQQEEEARLRAIKEEQDRAERERLAKEEAERKKQEDAKQFLLAGEDRGLFEYVAEELKTLRNHEVWTSFKSHDGKVKADVTLNILIQIIVDVERYAAEPKE